MSRFSVRLLAPDDRILLPGTGTFASLTDPHHAPRLRYATSLVAPRTMNKDRRGTMHDEQGSDDSSVRLSRTVPRPLVPSSPRPHVPPTPISPNPRCSPEDLDRAQEEVTKSPMLVEVAHLLCLVAVPLGLPTKLCPLSDLTLDTLAASLVRDIIFLK